MIKVLKGQGGLVCVNVSDNGRRGRSQKQTINNYGKNYYEK